MEKAGKYDHLSLKEVFEVLSQNNDRGAYNYFFNKYYPKLIWFTLLYVNDHNAAEEIVSDVLLTILKKREKISGMDSIEGYLFIVTKNQALKYLRKNTQLIYSEKLESEGDLLMGQGKSPEDEYIGNEFHRVVKDTIDALPTKRKMVFKLIKEDQLKYKDVATLLDLSIKTVEAHMGLAMKAVFRSIDEYRSENKQPARVINIKNKKN